MFNDKIEVRKNLSFVKQRKWLGFVSPLEVDSGLEINLYLHWRTKFPWSIVHKEVNDLLKHWENGIVQNNSVFMY